MRLGRRVHSIAEPMTTIVWRFPKRGGQRLCSCPSWRLNIVPVVICKQALGQPPIHPRRIDLFTSGYQFSTFKQRLDYSHSK
jgi:hypothetical protein